MHPAPLQRSDELLDALVGVGVVGVVPRINRVLWGRAVYAAGYGGGSTGPYQGAACGLAQPA